MSVNILNYTTKAPTGRTIGEITTLLVRKGAISVNMDYVAGKPSGLTFTIKIADTMIPFCMAPNVKGVLSKLPKTRNMEQAERVAWRILLRWVEAQMALIESNQAEMGQVFLPYAVRANGDTFWKAFKMSNSKQLGDESEAA